MRDFIAQLLQHYLEICNLLIIILCKYSFSLFIHIYLKFAHVIFKVVLVKEIKYRALGLSHDFLPWLKLADLNKLISKEEKGLVWEHRKEMMSLQNFYEKGIIILLVLAPDKL